MCCIIAVLSNFSSDKDLVLVKKPHAAQILSIFRLLCLSCGNVSGTPIQTNHFIEIPTGEKKICAVVYALFGYHVDVVCYSPTLKQRDNDDFDHIFCHFCCQRSSFLQYY